MSKERRERKRQWKKEMQEDWEILQTRLGLKEEPAPRKSFFRHPATIVVSSVCAVAIIGVSVGLGIYRSSLTQAKTPSTPSTPVVPVTPPSEQPPPQDQNRYCTQAEYTPKKVETTLKEYSAQYNNDILYFDWYNSLDYLKSTAYYLNATLETTPEVIAFKEELMHSDTGFFVTLYVMDNHTELEELSIFKNTCLETATVNNVEIKYSYGKSGGYSMWEYNGYRYYMQSHDVPTLEYTLGLIEELLQA